MNQGLLKEIDAHRKKLAGSHFIFSAENPSHKPELNMSHGEVLHHLKAAGYDAHSVNGHYDSPERSIIAYGVSNEQADHLHKLAGRLGQHSSLHSDGFNHELRFHQAEDKGRSIKGQGTDWHETKPQDNYTTLPGGVHHFSHKFAAFEKAENTETSALRKKYKLKWVSPGESKAEPEKLEKKDSSYHDAHKAPQSDDSPLHDLTLTGTFPKDIYSNKAARFYGHGDAKMDHESISAIHSVKDQPDKTVRMYRAVPSHVNTINHGDWVSLSPQYAKNHGENRMGEGQYKILHQDVPAHHLFSAGDIHEFGYNPPIKKTELAKAAPKTPSKHVGLARLKQIKQDHAIGEGGTEYDEGGLDEAITDRSISHADKLVQMADRRERSTPKQEAGPSNRAPIGVKPIQMMRKGQFSYMMKSADDDQYKKFAHSGMALMYPVQINGRTHNPHNDVAYHNTIKVFDRTKDSPDHVHELAQQAGLKPPSPEHVGVEPITLKGQGGYTVYALELTGNHTHEAKQHNSKFDGMGYETPYEFKPHVSVDKETWDDIKAKGHKTAKDAGISFGHAELRQGEKTLARYPHKNESATTSAMQAVREKPKTSARPKVSAKLGKSELLEKGFMRNLAVGAATVATLGSCAVAPPVDQAPKAGSHEIEQTHHVNAYDHDKMLRAIASVESSGGKNTNHRPTSSGTAYGKYALMPNTIRDTIRLNHDLGEHKKALDMSNDDLAHYIGDHPGLEQSLAEHHLKRLEQHFGNNAEHVGFAWNQGVGGTHKALKEKKDISGHPYVGKIRDAYRST